MLIQKLQHPKGQLRSDGRLDVVGEDVRMGEIGYLVEPLVLATDFKMVFAIHLCWLQPTLFK